MAGKEKQQSRYAALVEKIFADKYKKGSKSVGFEREDLGRAATALGIKLPSNIGDVLYSVRYRTNMPRSILKTQPAGQEWVIEGLGRAKYEFKLVRVNRIVPNPDLVLVKVPDATPEIISAHALTDEQALLAKVRYNRLIDVFLGVVAFSLQNHLRTFVKDMGQIEIDEVYVALDRHGRQYILPVQAKGGSDQLSVVQTKQDIKFCANEYPDLICRPISAQFMADEEIAMFELTVEGDHVKVVDERHYKLTPAEEITSDDLKTYRRRAKP
jgi:hypothetical protein